MLKKIFVLFLCSYCFSVYSNIDSLNQSEKFEYIFLATKSTNTLEIIEVSNNKILKNMNMAYGINDGNKNKEGDKKTPEGEYLINKIMMRNQLERYYGKKNVLRYGAGALVLNYPNKKDQSLGKTGSGIWIHGINNEEEIKKKRISKGCIVVSNQDFLFLSNIVKKHKVKVVILKNKSKLEELKEAYSKKKELNLGKDNLLL